MVLYYLYIFVYTNLSINQMYQILKQKLQDKIIPTKYIHHRNLLLKNKNWIKGSLLFLQIKIIFYD